MDERMVRIKWRVHSRRKACRELLPMYTWTFAIMFVSVPFVVFGGTAASQTEPQSGLFGLHPDLVKLIFYALFLISSSLVVRALNKVIKSIDNVHTNDREIVRALTQLITDHKRNHGQDIDLPRIEDNGSGV